MNKLKRNLSTKKHREFWKSIDEAAANSKYPEALRKKKEELIKEMKEVIDDAFRSIDQTIAEIGALSTLESSPDQEQILRSVLADQEAGPAEDLDEWADALVRESSEAND